MPFIVGRVRSLVEDLVATFANQSRKAVAHRLLLVGGVPGPSVQLADDPHRHSGSEDRVGSGNFLSVRFGSSSSSPSPRRCRCGPGHRHEQLGARAAASRVPVTYSTDARPRSSTRVRYDVANLMSALVPSSNLPTRQLKGVGGWSAVMASSWFRSENDRKSPCPERGSGDPTNRRQRGPLRAGLGSRSHDDDRAASPSRSSDIGKSARCRCGAPGRRGGRHQAAPWSVAGCSTRSWVAMAQGRGSSRRYRLGSSPVTVIAADYPPRKPRWQRRPRSSTTTRSRSIPTSRPGATRTRAHDPRRHRLRGTRLPEELRRPLVRRHRSRGRTSINTQRGGELQDPRGQPRPADVAGRKVASSPRAS